MVNNPKIPSHRILALTASDSQMEQLEAVTKALGSDKRLNILKYLGTHTASVLEIAEAEPDRYVATIAKARRTGRILLDFLRNGRNNTAVVAYGTRARPGAPVSMPLAWDELEPAIGPAHFTVANAPARVANGDLFQAQHLWTACLVEADSFGHRVSSLMFLSLRQA
mgnify:CR=1 FL=1